MASANSCHWHRHRGVQERAQVAKGLSVKKPCHHGELRQALIDAARALVREKGDDGFSLSQGRRFDRCPVPPFRRQT